MKSTPRQWTWVALALLALAVIAYVATPPLRSADVVFAGSSNSRWRRGEWTANARLGEQGV